MKSNGSGAELYNPQNARIKTAQAQARSTGGRRAIAPSRRGLRRTPHTSQSRVRWVRDSVVRAAETRRPPRLAEPVAAWARWW